MKQLLFAFIIILALCTDNYSQFKPENASVSVFTGYGGGGLDGTSAIPVGFELNILKLSENLQAGAFVAFATTSQEYDEYSIKGKWAFTSIVLALETTYHFYPDRKFDPFVGVSMGYNFASVRWQTNDSLLVVMKEPPPPDAGGFFYNGRAGINYWFTPSLAFQIRVGYFPYIAAAVVFGL